MNNNIIIIIIQMKVNHNKSWSAGFIDLLIYTHILLLLLLLLPFVDYYLLKQIHTRNLTNFINLLANYN